MKKFYFYLTIFFALQVNAQTYLISFAGEGLSSLKVENLKSGLNVTLDAGDVLRLSYTTGIPEVKYIKSSGIKIYPNPITDISTLEILPPVNGNAIVSVCDMTGKVLAQFKGYLGNYLQEFSLKGIKQGFHVINVKGDGYQFSGKLFSTGTSTGNSSIARMSTNSQPITEKKPINNSKGAQSVVDMTYNTGERLKYTGVSGNNSTVITDIPSMDKTVSFTFTECKDGDNNNYRVVQIGTQIWMAENLKTTEYKDGITPIPNVTGSAGWSTLSTPAYCWYNNDEVTYKEIYGALYNWYTVSTGNLCPAGWHVPANAEWTILYEYLGGINVAGGKLKETGTTHWNNPNSGATNETGYGAVPGGHLNAGNFVNLKEYGFWWSTTEYEEDVTFRWGATLGYTYAMYSENDINIKDGVSVRCLKD